jgi:hypothetical protein
MPVPAVSRKELTLTASFVERYQSEMTTGIFRKSADYLRRESVAYCAAKLG